MARGWAATRLKSFPMVRTFAQEPIPGSRHAVATAVPSVKETPMPEATVANQRQILANQRTILANQRAILANQKRIEGNQAKLDRLLRNQRKLDRILANQKSILARLR
jgi:uncharacterized membrane protein YidH (DUF202 family)